MIDDIKSNIKVWLDDCLLHTKTKNDLLATLNFFFKKCQEHGLKLHARKCVFFASTKRYCGRQITKGGVRFDPKNMEALQTMQEPQNGADLVQYLAAVNWMRSAIPNYSKRVAPLQAALAKVFECKSRRTKKAAAAVSLLHLWGPEEQAAFKDLQAAIMDSMTLAFPDPDKRICVLTDASDRFYAGLVTQIDEEQLDLPMEEQDHQPLTFLSGEFKGTQLRWTVPEKEGFAIVDTVTKVDYLLLSAPCCTQAATLGTQEVSVLLPHGARDGRAQLLDRPHDEVGSRMGSRKREQSAWQDGQPVCTAVHQPARLRYGGVSIEEGYSTGAEERCQ
jgi:RNase H-like domain found in reverse transcriptase